MNQESFKNFLKLFVLIIVNPIVYRVSNYFLNLPEDHKFSLWHFISIFITISVIYIVRINIRQTKFLSFAFIFIVYFLIGHFNILIEAYIFNVLDLSTTVRELLRGFMVTVITSLLAVYLFDGSEKIRRTFFIQRPLFSWTWRFVLIIFTYILFYGIAGILVQSTIAEFMVFYDNKIPSLEVILSTQVFRGGIFAAVTFVMTKLLTTKRLTTALIIGLTYSILGGIAPLITPNEHMPQYIRIIHGFEVGISNFLFGMISCFILTQNKKASK